MAKRQRDHNQNVLETAAVGIGRALGSIARRVDAWKKDRAAITADINQVISRAQDMLDDIERTPAPETIGHLGEIAHVAPTAPRRSRGGSAKAPAAARRSGARKSPKAPRAPRRRTE
jgi:hypothetical protein